MAKNEALAVFCPPCGESFEDDTIIVDVAPGGTLEFTCPHCKSELTYTWECEVVEADE